MGQARKTFTLFFSSQSIAFTSTYVRIRSGLHIECKYACSYVNAHIYTDQPKVSLHNLHRWVSIDFSYCFLCRGSDRDEFRAAYLLANLAGNRVGGILSKEVEGRDVVDSPRQGGWSVSRGGRRRSVRGRIAAVDAGLVCSTRRRCLPRIEASLVN